VEALGVRNLVDESALRENAQEVGLVGAHAASPLFIASFGPVVYQVRCGIQPRTLPMARATAIGLMSGTSYDGVDVALIETDGEEIGRLGPTGYRPYSDPEREVVRRAIAAAAHLADRSARPAMLAEAEELVTDMHAEAVEAFLAANGMPPSEVAVVGFHGQTVLHRPDRGLTIQLGNGAALAGRIGIPVVYDFRAADV